MALVEGRSSSLTDETHSLRRRRLLAAAVFLAATFGLLTLWVFVSDNPGTLTAGGSRLFAPGGVSRGALRPRGGRRGAAGERRIADATPSSARPNTCCSWACPSC